MDRPKFVITGATGWIGRALIDRIAHQYGTNWRSQVSAFASAHRTLVHPLGAIELKSLSEMSPADTEGSIVFHLAYLTKEKAGLGPDSAFLAANIALDEAVLSVLRTGPPQGLFVASSGAAADAERGRQRHVYGVGKLLQEDAFLTFASKFSVRTLIGRIYSISGPYSNKLNSYALSSFILQGLSQRKISIKADTPVLRSYLHVFDLVEIVLSELLCPAVKPSTVVDLCGQLIVEMDDIAREVAFALSPDDPVEISRVALRSLTPSCYFGDPSTTRSLALSQQRVMRSFAAQVVETRDFIASLGAAAFSSDA